MNIRRRALLTSASSLALMGLSPAQQLVLQPSTQPSLVLDFINGGPSGDGRLTTSRAAGGATYFDRTNTLQLASANTQRIDYGPTPTAGQVTNWIRNSSNVGAGAGTPGTLPTNWTRVDLVGITSQVVGTGVESGLPYVDIRWSGTAGAGGTVSLLTDTPTGVPTTVGTTWTSSLYVSLVGGSLSGMSGPIDSQVRFYNGTGAGLTGASGSFITPVTGSLLAQRTQFSRTATDATTGGTGQWIRMGITNGALVDMTLRFGGVQHETGTVANTFIPTSGSVVTTGAVPNGLLIEEARTNSIRNPRAEGAVASDGVEQVTNGTFAANPINASADTIQNGWEWTVNGGTGAVGWSGSAVTIIGDGTNQARIDTSITTVAGLVYNVTCDVTAQVLNLIVGTTRGGAALLNIVTAVGTGQAFQFTASGTTTWISFQRNASNTATLDNVSIKKAGVLPTNWQSVQNTGLSPSVIGVGSEQGVPYIDLQISGTTATGTQNQIVFDTGAIAATASQAWSFSSYFRLISGTIPSGIMKLLAGDNIATQTSPAINPTSAALSTQRATWSFTTNAGAVTAVANKAILFTFAAAPQTVSFVLRIGAPQLELGAFATSSILPAIGTPAATTRATDAVSMSVSGIANVATGTMQVEAAYTTLAQTVTSETIGIGADNNNTIRAAVAAAATSFTVQDFVSSTNQANITPTGTFSVGTPVKLAITYGGGFITACVNAGTIASSAVAATPPTLSTLWIGGGGGARGAMVNGYIRKVRYWPRALSSAELQAATT